MLIKHLKPYCFCLITDIKQGSVVTMAQATNKPAVGGFVSSNVGTALHARTNKPAVGGFVSSNVGTKFHLAARFVRLSFKTFKDRPDGVTMKVEDMNKQLKFQVRATGVPKEMELVDAVDGGTIVLLPTEGSIPSQWAAFRSSGQVNGAGEKLLTLTKTRVINKHTDLDVMTMKGLEQHNSFVKPLVHAGVAYKMIGSWSGRSIVVREMSQGVDKDSFIVDVHPSANTVFVVSLFAIANAMKNIGTFDGASFSFGLAIAGHIVAGIAYDAIGGCVGDACAEGGCACCC
ncbi:putative tubby-like protein [Helianthus annuus]|nr:putative tubby-like protein [Helianthus annuus]